MASGRKNYFRHSFFARNDIKMRHLRDQLGVGFYFYFFSLLEQCGEASCESLKENYEFHDSIIRDLWGVNLKKCVHVASVMSAVGLLLFEKREKTFYFEIPNFAKYLGKYESKLQTNTSNKRKEKKRKENEIKEIKNADACALQRSELLEINDSVFSAFQFSQNYPRDVFDEFAREAYPLYVASEKEDKQWRRFLTNYIKNNSGNIRDYVLKKKKEEKPLSDYLKEFFPKEN